MRIDECVKPERQRQGRADTTSAHRHPVPSLLPSKIHPEGFLKCQERSSPAAQSPGECQVRTLCHQPDSHECGEDGPSLKSSQSSWLYIVKTARRIFLHLPHPRMQREDFGPQYRYWHAGPPPLRSPGTRELGYGSGRTGEFVWRRKVGSLILLLCLRCRGSVVLL